MSRAYYKKKQSLHLYSDAGKNSIARSPVSDTHAHCRMAGLVYTLHFKLVAFCSHIVVTCLRTKNEKHPDCRAAYSHLGCVAGLLRRGACCLQPKHSGAHLWRLTFTFKLTTNVRHVAGLHDTFSVGTGLSSETEPRRDKGWHTPGTDPRRMGSYSMFCRVKGISSSSHFGRCA